MISTNTKLIISILKVGWKQFDTVQEASYFGIWVHEENRRIVTYSEGGLTEVICPDQEDFAVEIRTMEVFYEPMPPAFLVIDRQGNITHIYDTRPSINPEPQT